MFLKEYLLLNEIKTIVTGDGFWYYTGSRTDLLLLRNQGYLFRQDYVENKSICDILQLPQPLTLYDNNGLIVYEETKPKWIEETFYDTYVREYKQRTWNRTIYRDNQVRGVITNYYTDEFNNSKKIVHVTKDNKHQILKSTDELQMRLMFN